MIAGTAILRQNLAAFVKYNDVKEYLRWEELTHGKRARHITREIAESTSGSRKHQLSQRHVAGLFCNSKRTAALVAGTPFMVLIIPLRAARRIRFAISSMRDYPGDETSRPRGRCAAPFKAASAAS